MFENVKEALRARIRPSSIHLTALRGDLQSRLRHFKAERTQEQQKSLEEDFAQVLLAWGIGEQDIPAVLWELRLRRWVGAGGYSHSARNRPKPNRQNVQAGPRSCGVSVAAGPFLLRRIHALSVWPVPELWSIHAFRP